VTGASGSRGVARRPVGPMRMTDPAQVAHADGNQWPLGRRQVKSRQHRDFTPDLSAACSPRPQGRLTGRCGVRQLVATSTCRPGLYASLTICLLDSKRLDLSLKTCREPPRRPVTTGTYDTDGEATCRRLARSQTCKDARGPAFLAKGLRGVFGPEEIERLETRRQDRRITASRLLPEILRLKGEGLCYRLIAERLGVTRKSVEHCLRRWRRRGG
jgi:hypothetical protein